MGGFYRVGILTAALAVGPALLVPGCGPAGRGPTAAVRVSETRRLMGVPWTITLHASSPEAGRAAVAAGFAEVERLERMLSDYVDDSELSRLSAQAPTAAAVPVSADLWRVLERAVQIRDATAGAFDPTVGPLTRLWRQARRSGRMPQADRLSAARAAVGPQTLRLDPVARAVMLERPGMRLDLGGIGMGYAVDRVLEVLAGLGISSAMVDASGDIGVSAAPPGTPGWRVAVAPLRAAGGHAGPNDGEQLVLCHAAVTTSGDAFQAVEIGGRRYSHIVDPRTGLGVAGPAAVTVVAADCTTADALATAASVLGPDEGAAAIAATPGCAARFAWLEDGSIRHACTPGWSTQTTQAPSQSTQPSM